MWSLLEILTAAGRKRAAAPMFCMKLDMRATVPDIRVIILVLDLPASFIMWLASTFITPVLSRPAPMIMTAIIETTALLLRPLIAFSGSTRPRSGSRTIISIPTTSTLTSSDTKRNMASTRTSKVRTFLLSRPATSSTSSGSAKKVNAISPERIPRTPFLIIPRNYNTQR